MADTKKLKIELENWFRRKLEDENPGRDFKQEKVPLKWGGVFEYDAVLKDEKGNVESVYLLSSSEYKTASGNNGAGKFQKILGDILRMEGTKSENKYLYFTGKTMYDKVEQEQINGRIPNDIKLKYIDLHEENPTLNKLVLEIRKKSENENN